MQKEKEGYSRMKMRKTKEIENCRGKPWNRQEYIGKQKEVEKGMGKRRQQKGRKKWTRMEDKKVTGDSEGVKYINHKEWVREWNKEKEWKR